MTISLSIRLTVKSALDQNTRDACIANHSHDFAPLQSLAEERLQQDLSIKDTEESMSQNIFDMPVSPSIGGFA